MATDLGCCPSRKCEKPCSGCDCAGSCSGDHLEALPDAVLQQHLLPRLGAADKKILRCGPAARWAGGRSRLAGSISSVACGSAAAPTAAVSALLLTRAAADARAYRRGAGSRARASAS